MRGIKCINVSPSLIFRCFLGPQNRIRDAQARIEHRASIMRHWFRHCTIAGPKEHDGKPFGTKDDIFWLTPFLSAWRPRAVRVMAVVVAILSSWRHIWKDQLSKSPHTVLHINNSPVVFRNTLGEVASNFCLVAYSVPGQCPLWTKKRLQKFVMRLQFLVERTRIMVGIQYCRVIECLWYSTVDWIFDRPFELSKLGRKQERCTVWNYSTVRVLYWVLSKFGIITVCTYYYPMQYITFPH